MDYASFTNQFTHLAHYALSFLFVSVLAPRLLFRVDEEDGLLRNAGYFLRIVFCTIAAGYLLVLTKLFEVLALLGLLLFPAVWLALKRSAPSRPLIDSAASLIFNLLDGKWPVAEQAAGYGRRKARQARAWLAARMLDPEAAIGTVLLAAIFAVAAWMRFDDALTQAAPPMSDSYVTLAWMKYIDDRVLFHDGIYPQGFHIFMDVLRKFAGIDPLYILKYTGPLDAMLTMAGLYLAVSRMGGRGAGIVAAAVYGLWSPLIFGSDWERQAATNSQEFAFLFIWPALLFLKRYLSDGRKRDLRAFFCGAAVIGLVHALAYFYLVLAALALLAAMLIGQFRTVRPRLGRVVLAGAASGILALLPLGLGLMMGRPLHASSESYLSATAGNIPQPQLLWVDKLSLAAAVAMTAAAVPFLLRSRAIRGAVASEAPKAPNASNSPGTVFLFGGLLGIGMFALFAYGGSVTGSVLLASRSTDLWALTIPAVLGFAWHLLWSWRPGPGSRLRWGRLLLLATLVIATAHIVPPAAVHPYKMERDEKINQYLRIAKLYPAKSWVWYASDYRVSYALIMGQGFPQLVHNMLRNDDPGELLNNYDPTKPALTRYGADKPDPNVPHDIFITYDKSIYQMPHADPTLLREYREMAVVMQNLQRWLAVYRRYHSGAEQLQIFYDSPTLRIYHIHIPLTDEQRQEKIWGKG